MADIGTALQDLNRACQDTFAGTVVTVTPVSDAPVFQVRADFRRPTEDVEAGDATLYGRTTRILIAREDLPEGAEPEEEDTVLVPGQGTYVIGHVDDNGEGWLRCALHRR